MGNLYFSTSRRPLNTFSELDPPEKIFDSERKQKLSKIISQIFVKGYLVSQKPSFMDLPRAFGSRQGILLLLDQIASQLSSASEFSKALTYQMKSRGISKRSIEDILEKKKSLLEKMEGRCEEIRTAVKLLKSIFRDKDLDKVILRSEAQNFCEYDPKDFRTDKVNRKTAIIEELSALISFIDQAYRTCFKERQIKYCLDISPFLPILSRIKQTEELTRATSDDFARCHNQLRDTVEQYIASIRADYNRLGADYSAEEFCKNWNFPLTNPEDLMEDFLGIISVAGQYSDYFKLFKSVFDFAQLHFRKFNKEALPGVLISYQPLVDSLQGRNYDLLVFLHFFSTILNQSDPIVQKFEMNVMLQRMDRVYADYIVKLDTAFAEIEKDQIIKKVCELLRGQVDSSRLLKLTEFENLKDRYTPYCQIGQSFLNELRQLKIDLISHIKALVAANPQQFSIEDLAALDRKLATMGVEYTQALNHLLLTTHLDHVFIEPSEIERASDFPHIDQILEVLVIDLAEEIEIPRVNEKKEYGASSASNSQVVEAVEHAIKELEPPESEAQAFPSASKKSSKTKKKAEKAAKTDHLVKAPVRRTSLFQEMKEKILKGFKPTTSTKEYVEGLAELDIYPDHITGDHLILKGAKTKKNVVVPIKDSLPPGTVGSIKRMADAAAGEASSSLGEAKVIGKGKSKKSDVS